ncbi:DUF4386 domain-containing protein [soil metagenome]
MFIVDNESNIDLTSHSKTHPMNSNKSIARLAGLLYLIVVLTGMFSLLFVPSRLIVPGDDAVTVSNIIANETLFRLGILASVVCYLAFLTLPLVLFKLLNHINKTHAILMVALASVSVPITLINLLNRFAVLTWLGNADYIARDQVQTEVMLHLDYYNNGIQLASIFWGLWLFPFGYLVFKSGFIPKIFGVLLMAGCIGYLINFIGKFFFPGYGDLSISSIVGMPSALGEIGVCLWLLIVGVRNASRGNA